MSRPGMGLYFFVCFDSPSLAISSSLSALIPLILALGWRGQQLLVVSRFCVSVGDRYQGVHAHLVLNAGNS